MCACVGGYVPEPSGWDELHVFKEIAHGKGWGEEKRGEVRGG